MRSIRRCRPWSARKFATYTRDNVGRPYAIVLEGRVISTPLIRDAVPGGAGQISANFTVDETHRTAAQIVLDREREGHVLFVGLTLIKETSVMHGRRRNRWNPAAGDMPPIARQERRLLPGVVLPLDDGLRHGEN